MSAALQIQELILEKLSPIHFVSVYLFLHFDNNEYEQSNSRKLESGPPAGYLIEIKPIPFIGLTGQLIYQLDQMPMANYEFERHAGH